MTLRRLRCSNTKSHVEHTYVKLEGGVAESFSCPGRPEKHDYERGEDRHAMHTETMCRICGHAKNDRSVHR